MAEETKPKAPKDKAEPLRKISTRTVLGSKDEDVKGMILEKVMKDKTKDHPLLRVWGVATRYKPGNSDFGAFLKFNGQFRALNIETGAVYRSAALLLPKFLEDELAGALGSMDAPKPSEFAIEIGAKYDKTSATSYVFTANSLVETSESDQMKQLESRIRSENPRALPAPAKS